ncbi:MAG TPA: response regulator transcription factor [Gemmatimonadaceae bacterium]|jgi:two-component system alkaline phosphatase synthesis response regulator PhoP
MIDQAHDSTATTARSVLIVEDSETLALGLSTSFEFEGYGVHWVADGQAALDWLASNSPDLIILDLMLPKVNGFEVLRRFRADGGTSAVLILSARDAEVDKVQGFRSGADDYVVKPVGILELLARAEAMLRRIEPQSDGRGESRGRAVADLHGASRAAGSTGEGRPNQTLRFGNVVIDSRTRTVTRDGAPVDLTPREYELLVFLIQADGAIISREHVMDEVWHYVPGLTSRTVDQHVARLRHKLETDAAAPQHILTARKAGYRFVF